MTIVDLSGRTLSGQTVEAFWRSIEHAEPLVVGVNCSLGADRDAPARRRAGPARRHLRRLPPQRRPAQRVRRLRPDAGRDRPRCSASSPTSGLVNIVGGCCGTTPAHIAQIAAAVAGLRAARRSPAPHAGHPVQRPGAVRDRPGHRLRHDRRADQRHRLGPVPPADRGRRPPGRGRRRAGAGARRRQPARRQHGRRPARQRAGDDHVPQPDRDRARGGPDPDHDRQLEVERARGRAQVRAGQGRGQLDQPQGGRGGRSSSRPAGSATTAPAWS